MSRGGARALAACWSVAKCDRCNNHLLFGLLHSMDLQMEGFLISRFDLEHLQVLLQKQAVAQGHTDEPLAVN